MENLHRLVLTNACDLALRPGAKTPGPESPEQSFIFKYLKTGVLGT